MFSCINSLPRIFVLFFTLFLISCGQSPEEEQGEVVRYEKTTFSDMDGWNEDSHADGLIAFQKSCARILKRPSDKVFKKDLPVFGTYGDWQDACEKSDEISADQAKAFFENNFTPYQVFDGEKGNGLFTGYYEPSLSGSLTNYGDYQTPLYALPDDLVMVDLGLFRDDLKGRRIAGRVKGNRLKPYEDRGEIEAGKLPKLQQKPLLWVDDPVDAFFLHIQGSGRVALDTGEAIRVGYAGQNGHPYFAIGRALIDMGEIEKEEISLQSIREWLKKNPEKADDIMNLNPSYVFFRRLGTDGPVGAEGIVLTPERSLAVDRTRYPYGLPVWINVEHPVIDDDQMNIKRLMVAQDTGGAIRGQIRGDFFWGVGDKAEDYAGQMASSGSLWILLPNHLKLKQ